MIVTSFFIWTQSLVAKLWGLIKGNWVKNMLVREEVFKETMKGPRKLRALCVSGMNFFFYQKLFALGFQMQS